MPPINRTAEVHWFSHRYACHVFCSYARNGKWGQAIKTSSPTLATLFFQQGSASSPTFPNSVTSWGHMSLQGLSHANHRSNVARGTVGEASSAAGAVPSGTMGHRDASCSGPAWLLHALQLQHRSSAVGVCYLVLGVQLTPRHTFTVRGLPDTSLQKPLGR